METRPEPQEIDAQALSFDVARRSKLLMLAKGQIKNRVRSNTIILILLLAPLGVSIVFFREHVKVAMLYPMLFALVIWAVAETQLRTNERINALIQLLEEQDVIKKR